MAVPPAKQHNPTVTRSAMSPRLLQLAAETNTPQPYPVTDDITVTPLTRTRMNALQAAEMKLYALRGLLNNQIVRKADPEPVPAAGPEPALFHDASDEQRAEYEDAHHNWEQQRAADAKLHTEWVAKQDAAVAEIESIRQQLDDAQREYERAFFGEAYTAVIDYFEDKPLLWNKFSVDIKNEFLPPAPHNGVCPTCGHTDEVQAGKVESSSN